MTTPSPARGFDDDAGSPPLLALVGSPNVGKSVMFVNLTGRYAVVSNYPGTTVEVSRGRALIGGREFEVVDTPGMYSLQPITDEERVARPGIHDLIAEPPYVGARILDADREHLAIPNELTLSVGIQHRVGTVT